MSGFSRLEDVQQHQQSLIHIYRYHVLVLLPAAMTWSACRTQSASECEWWIFSHSEELEQCLVRI